MNKYKGIKYMKRFEMYQGQGQRLDGSLEVLLTW